MKAYGYLIGSIAENLLRYWVSNASFQGPVGDITYSFHWLRMSCHLDMIISYTIEARVVVRICEAILAFNVRKLKEI